MLATADPFVTSRSENIRCRRFAPDPQTWPAWLGEKPADPRELKALLSPYPSDEMTCWPVSARVGNVKNNDPSLIEPLAANEPA